MDVGLNSGDDSLPPLGPSADADPSKEEESSLPPPTPSVAFNATALPAVVELETARPFCMDHEVVLGEDDGRRAVGGP